jgi:hypothetical protein
MSEDNKRRHIRVSVNICPSCGRDVTKIHRDYRGRMANGHMGHLEYDPQHGTTLVDEGK